MARARNLDRPAPAWIRALLCALALGAGLYTVLLVGGTEAVGLPVDPHSWWPVGALALGASLACAAGTATLGR